jgi:tetratricopeptide (TPR) repeat protein
LGVISFFKNYPKFWLSLIVALVVWLSYANGISAPFIWDDEEMVVGNPLIQDIGQINQIFTSGAFLEKLDAGKFYRPVQITSYTLDYALWGLKASGFRCTSITIHMLSALTLLFLLVAFDISLLPAFLITLLWAVHPMHIEAVTYISGRGDALYLLFCLLSFLSFVHALKSKHKWLYFLSFLAWIVAILAKENALPLPLIMVLYLWVSRRHILRKEFFITALTNLGLVAAYVGFRLFVLKGASTGTLSWIASSTLIERIQTLPYIIFTYIKLWFLPYPLHMEYHYVEETLLNPYLFIGLPFVGLLFWIFWKAVKPSQFWFFSGWIFLGLAPVYQVMIPLASTIREHWFYLSGIGLAALCILSMETLIINVLSKWLRLALWLGLGLWVATCIGLTIHRNEDWKSPLRLYEHDLQFEPRSFLLHNNVGVEYFRQGRIAEAKTSFKNAIDFSPGDGYGTAYNNYGVVIENEGKINEAIELYRKSIASSQYQLAYGNLARLYLNSRRPVEAEKVLAEGIHINPYNPQLRYYLGGSLLQQRRYSDAVKIFTELERLSPNYEQTRAILQYLKTHEQ